MSQTDNIEKKEDNEEKDRIVSYVSEPVEGS